MLRMTALTSTLLASFTAPMQIDTTPASMLWLLPLVVAIAVVYKATKVSKIRLVPFVKETGVLIGSILVFITVAALVLYIGAWFANEHMAGLLNRPGF